MSSGAELEFASRLARLTAKWGLGESVGRIMAVLLLNRDPMTQDEISRMTGYSLGLISSTLALLESLGLVIVARKRGRKRLYRASGSLLDLLERFLEELVERQLSPTIGFLRENLAKFDERTRVNAENLLQECEKARLLLKQSIEHLREWKRLPLRELAKKMSIQLKEERR